jgi:7,8-dihydroneopterin aldolase/epimerase/oxygenase
VADRYQLFLEDVRLKARVGVHAKEKKAPQPLHIDLVVEVTRRGSSDALHSVLSYGEALQVLRDACLGPAVGLLETLAERIFVGLFADPRVMGAMLRIARPNVLPDAGAAGIVMKKSRV